MLQQATHLAQVLAEDLGVNPGYRHVRKHVMPGASLDLPGVVLKWYEVHPEDRAVPDDVARLARAYLTAHPLEARGLGFVILHRCGTDFYFLILCTWRNENELWSTVFYKDGDAMADFAPFPRDGAHKPAFCVWELVPVWHEQQAWVRFLTTPRDEAAAQEWLGDRYAGPA